MNWLISKNFTFEASHLLPLHDGKCQRLHGHSWKATIYILGDKLIKEGSKSGMVMDYADIKKVFKPILERKLDHYHLNESLNIANPTSENVAKWIYNQIKDSLPNLIGVKVNETCTSSCFYTDEKINLSMFNSILGG